MFRTASDSASTVAGTLERGLDGDNQRFVGGMATDGVRSALELRASLLEKTIAHSQQAQIPADIIILGYRELPSEQTTSAHGLKMVEQPGGKNFPRWATIRHYLIFVRRVSGQF
eukprot:2184222-Amphidinium_carterae.2